MNILLIHCSTDKYSHDDYHLNRQMLESDYSLADMLSVKEDYKRSFQRKSTMKIGIVHLDVSADGTVTVVENLQGEHPLLQRREINPAAIAARAARQAQKISVVFDEISAT